MKIICVGRNYVEHINELKNKKSSFPVLFIKPDSSLILKNNPFLIPDFAQNIHYEIEFIVKYQRLVSIFNQNIAISIMIKLELELISRLELYKKSYNRKAYLGKKLRLLMVHVL